jgi:hypothetical protein
MLLTDDQIKNAQPRYKEYELFDSHGLYIAIAPSGGNWWRLKYKCTGKDKRLSLGVYPEVGIEEANAEADVACKLIAQGLDPSAERKKQKVALIGEDDTLCVPCMTGPAPSAE